MNLAAILRIAMRALARNKLRSALTMLGIIIGVGAVIAMVSVGQGAQQQAQAADRGDGFQHSFRQFRFGYPRRNAHGLRCNQNTRLRRHDCNSA